MSCDVAAFVKDVESIRDGVNVLMKYCSAPANDVEHFNACYRETILHLDSTISEPEQWDWLYNLGYCDRFINSLLFSGLSEYAKTLAVGFGDKLRRIIRKRLEVES